jgi:P4 family phage/plasmid primase-like protien
MLVIFITNIMQSEEMKFKIYDLKDYCIRRDKKTNDFEEKNGKCKIFEGNIEEVCKELEKNKGYNMRLKDDDKTILFGDLDKYKKDIGVFINEIKNYLCKIGLEICEEDFYYTENKGYDKDGKSYHYSLPRYNGKIKNIKKLLSDFKEEYGYSDEIDLSIYCDKWWRLPNQKKNNKKNSEHVIEKGEMKDFVVTYINEDSINIDDLLENNEESTMKLYEVKKNNSDISFDIKNNQKYTEIKNNNVLIELGEILKEEYIDNYNDWLKILWSLKKEGENNKELAREISKRSSKYDEESFEKIWDQYSADEITLTIGTFLYMAKESNKEEYLKIIKKYNNDELKKLESIKDDDTTIISDITLSNLGESKIEKKLKEIEIIIDKILGTKKDYFNNKEEFKELGSIIKYECRENEDLGIDFFQNICKTKLNNYNEKDFYKYWYTLSIDNNKKLTINSLKNKLKKILPEIQENLNLNVFELISDYKLAKEWTQRYGDKYVCVDVDKKIFLEWNGIWEETKSGSNIRLSLSEEFKNIFLEQKNKDCLLLSHLKKNKEDSNEDSDEEKIFKDLIKVSEKIIEKLENNSNKNKIFKEIQDMIKDKNKIVEKMNKTKYELPLKNCKIFNILTLETRERTKNDYFNYECPVNYVVMKEEEEKEIKDYFLSLFCNNEETTKCVLDIIKSQLIGAPLRYIFFWNGSGCNGKSLLFEILSSIFHKAIDIISKDVILEKKHNSHLNTEMEKLEKCRIGYITELKERDKLNETTIKQITGGDRIDIRCLLKTNETRIPTSNLNVLTNEMPRFDVEPAILDRIVTIPFKNKFEVNNNIKEDLLKKKDLLFTYIMKYGVIRDKIEESEEMKYAKDEYKLKNEKDYLSDYINDNYTFEESSRVKKDELREDFNNWCKNRDFKKNTETERSFTNTFLKKFPCCKVEHSHSIIYYKGIEKINK